MRLHFSRNKLGEATVGLVENNNALPFNYTTLVKQLINSGDLEETTFDEGFANEEKASVNSMVQLLTEACRKVGDEPAPEDGALKDEVVESIEA
jgi:hypothetical protein